ncbi:Pyruvate carboxyltransferase [Senna tora]|uniref:Pyruvate carboxyltransferase n=1 Tax=Senna tora TaxID=362788 RepID=A0A834U1R3_9FABA|nr:Pyruvate carboxyltransferase [Senna tora]
MAYVGSPDNHFVFPAYTSSSSSNTGSSNGNVENAPQYIFPRQGPLLDLKDQFVAVQRSLWANRVIAALIDAKDMPIFRLQAIIDNNWKLLGNVHVRAKVRNFFILEFETIPDRIFMLTKGPWAIQNSLLVLDKWRPGLTVEDFRMEKIAVWFRFYGVPLEYMCDSITELIGETVAPVNGVYFPMEDGRKIWVDIIPERTYRVCEQCGRIGHLSGDCNWSVTRTTYEMDEQRHRIYEKLGTPYWMQSHYMHFQCPRRKTPYWHLRPTTRVQAEFDEFGEMYRVTDLRHPQNHNIIDADWTSDSLDSDEMYVLHEIPVPEPPPENNQNVDQDYSQGTVQSDPMDVDQGGTENQETASQPMDKLHVVDTVQEENGEPTSQTLIKSQMASDKRSSFDQIDADVVISEALNAPNFMYPNEPIISDTRKDLEANSNPGTEDAHHALNDTSNILMNLSQMGDTAKNTFAELANYLYKNQIGPKQTIKLGQQLMSAQNGKLTTLDSTNFQGLLDPKEPDLGLHESTELTIDRLMSYAGKMTHLFNNNYKAWYAKIIENGYMIDDNEWNYLNSKSELGLALVGKNTDGEKDFIWDLFCCRLGLYPKFKWFLCTIFYSPSIKGPFISNPFNWYFLLNFWAYEMESSLLRNQLTFRPPIIWIKTDKKLAISLKRKRIEEICSREFEAWKQKRQKKEVHAKNAGEVTTNLFSWGNHSTLLTDRRLHPQTKNKLSYQSKDAGNNNRPKLLKLDFFNLAAPVLIALIREHDLVILNGFGEAVPQQPPKRP